MFLSLSLSNAHSLGYREYRVQVAETDSAKLIGASGECLLILSKGHLYLASASSKKVKGVWPYDSLRRYYCIEGMFGFVAGRRSPRGEGEFKFVTSQKEDIYHRLERAILRAKRGSEGSTSSAEEVKGGVDNRPPAPLPGSQQQKQQQQQQVPPQQETPVQTSESDEDPFHNSPTFSPTLKAILTDPPASEISPAYGRFGSNSGSQRVGREGARGAGGGRGQGSSWLHESVSVVPQPQEGSSISSKKPTPEPQVPKRPPLPPSRNSQISMVPMASEEDTYSHTVHPVPEQFQKKNIEHNVVGGTMYNALVHQRPQNVHRTSSRPNSDADASLYDVAFPGGRKVISSGGGYATARHPDVPQYTPGAPHLPPRRGMSSATVMPPTRGGHGWDTTDSGAVESQQHEQQQQQQQVEQKSQSQEAKKAPLPPPPSSGAMGETRQQQKNGDDEGMTTNPMYGAQEPLLTELAILNMNEQLREFELDSSIPEGYSGRVVHTSSGAAGVSIETLEMIEDGDQEFTPNPIYGELAEEQKIRILEEERRAKLNLSSHVEEGEAAKAKASGPRTGELGVEGGGERYGESGDKASQDTEVEDRSLLTECDQGMAQRRQEVEAKDNVNVAQGGKEGEGGAALQNRQERESSQLSTSSSTTTASIGEQSAASAMSDGSGIQRDAKGYSKVDKSKKASNVEGADEVSGGAVAGNNSSSESREGSSLPVDIPLAAVPNTLAGQNSLESNGTPPPPLPERNYSFDESELNQPPVASRGNET